MTSTNLQTLANQVTNGDRSAAQTMRAELEPHLHRIVRRALSAQATPTGFTQRLRQEADQIGADLSTATVASRLTGRVVNRLRSSPAVPLHARDTLVNSFAVS